jgi:hypothetical protein
MAITCKAEPLHGANIQLFFQLQQKTGKNFQYAREAHILRALSLCRSSGSLGRF